MIQVDELTIMSLSDMYREKKVSVYEIVKEYLNRIEQADKGEDGLNSILEINPDALSIANELDKEGIKKNSSPLYGIPILLKDNINTADKMHTSAGSLALADNIAKSDADIVKKLRDKGVIILGKTNMTEFANYMTVGMPAGYSSRGGFVKSPYKKGADPSGSSTGSAVAVSSNLCLASLGTDTSNSIVSPAIKNSIVGFRPSIGNISQKGITPISFTLDTTGPMTRTVEDAAIIFYELTNTKLPMDNKDTLKGKKVGINEWALKNMSGQESKRAQSIIKVIEREGANIIRLNIESIPTDNIKSIAKYEFKYSINRYLQSLSEGYHIRSLQDIIDYNNQNPDTTLCYGQKLLLDAQDNTKGDMSEDKYINLLKDREGKRKYMMNLLEDIDLCIMFNENLVLQYTGLPIITIPKGLNNDGMPYGIIVTADTDEGLLSNSNILEKVVGERVQLRTIDSLFL